jgi:hypothetical protein
MRNETNERTILYKINVVTSYEDIHTYTLHRMLGRNVFTCFFSFFIICNMSLYIGWINIKLLWTEEDATAIWSCFEWRTSCVSWNSFLFQFTLRVLFVCLLLLSRTFSHSLILLWIVTYLISFSFEVGSNGIYVLSSITPLVR